MPNLIEAVAAERAGRRRSICQVGALLAELDADRKPARREIAAELRTVLATGDLSAPEISRGLKRLGFTLSSNPIARHRRGDCACPQ